jgi:hypothetical protein
MSATVLFDLDGCSIRHPATGADVIQGPDGPDFSVWQVKACQIRPRRPVSTLWRLAKRAGLRVVVVTARSAEIGAATRAACESVGLIADQWIFRPAGDHRPAAEFKAEAVRGLAREGLSILAAFDDEAANVQALRSLGVFAVRVPKAKPLS